MKLLNSISLNTLSNLLVSLKISLITLFDIISFYQLTTFTRLSKAPYADSYWFMYSAKLTYYTER